MKQEWTALRDVFTHGVDLGVVSANMLPSLKQDKTTGAKRPAITQDEYQQLIQFLPTWPTQTRHPRIRRGRDMLQNYVMIKLNSGMRVGEARGRKWRDFDTCENPAGEWVTLNVQGETGKRLMVCQPDTQRYFNRLGQRGYRTDLDHLVFCHEDELRIEDGIGFFALLKAAGVERDTLGNKRSIYSLRHTYATFRLQHGTNIYWLKKNIGTSVAMIERHYGQTNVLIGIEHESAKRKKALRNDRITEAQKMLLKGKNADELVPMGAVDLTPAEEGNEED